jgi:hypothetical protein
MNVPPGTGMRVRQLSPWHWWSTQASSSLPSEQSGYPSQTNALWMQDPSKHANPPSRHGVSTQTAPPVWGNPSQYGAHAGRQVELQ